jgi:hypothetical protein
MDPSIAAIARRSAAQFGPQVAMEVEALLAGANPGQQPQYMDTGTALALASLIVSVAQFAWQIYRDISKAGGTPSVESVERRVMIRLEQEGRLPPLPQCDAAIRCTVEVVITEKTTK